MKIANKKHVPEAGTFNVFSLGAISFTWAHFLGLISLWFLPLTIFMYVVGYGSEVRNVPKTEQSNK
tara:strand:+ start:223 stop:420 length:198 start_codon:yes stop_codon:yes gene_type:complete